MKLISLLKRKEATRNKELPSWYGKNVIPESISNDERSLSNYLNSIRNDVYTTLSLYQGYSKIVISTLLISIGIVSVIDTSTKVYGYQPNIENLLGAILIFTGIIGSILIALLYQYYRVYTSALLFCAEVHYSVGIHGPYWVKRMTDFTKNKHSIKPCHNRDQVVSLRARSPTDSFFINLIVFGFMCVSFVAIGIFLITP